MSRRISTIAAVGRRRRRWRRRGACPRAPSDRSRVDGRLCLSWEGVECWRVDQIAAGILQHARLQIQLAQRAALTIARTQRAEPLGKPRRALHRRRQAAARPRTAGSPRSPRPAPRRRRVRRRARLVGQRHARLPADARDQIHHVHLVREHQVRGACRCAATGMPSVSSAAIERQRARSPRAWRPRSEASAFATVALPRWRNPRRCRSRTSRPSVPRTACGGPRCRVGQVTAARRRPRAVAHAAHRAGPGTFERGA